MPWCRPTFVAHTPPISLFCRKKDHFIPFMGSLQFGQGLRFSEACMNPSSSVKQTEQGGEISFQGTYSPHIGLYRDNGKENGNYYVGFRV